MSQRQPQWQPISMLPTFTDMVDGMLASSLEQLDNMRLVEMEDHVQSNPVKRVRQKSRFVRTQSKQEPIRRLSDLQWDYVIETAEVMAAENPRHERTLFIMSALYGMYLRISELVDTQLWSPMMKHFGSPIYSGAQPIL